MILTSFLLVSVYVPQLAIHTNQIKPTTTYKLYSTQAECHEVRNQMQKQVKVGISHTFCMKVKHSTQ